jgi:superfamily II DNA or RNA helicase
MRTKTMALPPADLILIDEAHHTPARTYQKLIEAYPDAIVIGLTATPCRGDGRGLGSIYKLMIECPQVPDLIKQGYLVRSRVYAPVTPDLKGVKVRAGDYVEEQLAGRMDTDKLVGDVVTHWHRLAERRRTIVFATSVGHSRHLADEFAKSGVKVEHLDGTTPEVERTAMLERLASGETEVITNCMVLTEGFDLPDVGCITLARPTKKMGLFRQMIGRGLRPAEGKVDCIILDHSGAVFEHGLPEDRVEWPLAPDRKATSPTHAARGNGRNKAKLVTCAQCSAIRLPGEPCSNCGYMPKPPARIVPVREGELGLVTNGRARAAPNNPETRRRWHAMFKHIAAERGYKPGWVAHKYREKFGAFPNWHADPPPIPPSPEVKSWVRSRAIAYAKRPTP